MFPEPPEVLLCKLLLDFFPRDDSGRARFVERISAEESEIDAYMYYYTLATQKRDLIRKLSNKEIDQLLPMSDGNWDKLIDFVVSQEGYVPPTGGALTRGRKWMVVYKLFCIVNHDRKMNLKEESSMRNMLSYKSFVTLSNLCGMNNIINLKLVD
jgi:hypothetical protein